MALKSAAASVLLLSLIAQDARGQDGQVSSLVGTVVDQSGGVVAGVQMTARSAAMIGGVVAAVTDDRGQYRFSSLLPGVYELAADRAGFQTWRRASIELRPGLAVSADVRLELAGFEQTTSASASASIVNVRTSAVPMLIDHQWLEHLPLWRDFGGYVNLVPGVTQGIAFGGSPGSISSSLDGTGVSSSEFGVSDLQPSAYWLESAQVISLGANAQYGEYTSARFNAVTRSGSNAWSGLADFWLTRNEWVGDNRTTLDQNTALRFLPAEILERWDARPQIGGPIKRDRVWLFAGFEHYVNGLRPAAFSLTERSANEPVNRMFESKLLTKLTAAPARDLRLEGYLEAEQGTIENGGAGPLTAPESVFQYNYPRRAANARLTWTIGPQTLFEAQYGVYGAQNELGPTPPDTRAGPSAHSDTFTGTLTSNYPSFDDTRRGRQTIGAILTRYATQGSAATHELKTGVEYERASYQNENGLTGGLEFLDFNGAPDLVMYRDVALIRGVHHRTSAFVQDTWRATGRLTIEPGVRVGFYHGSVPVAGTPSYDTSSISPRIGAAWDLTADHRTVVRGHYGIYHDGLFANVYDVFDPAANPVTVVAKVVGPNQFEEVTRYGGSSLRMSMASGVRQPYAEEYLAGVDREIAAGVSLRTQYIRRNFKQSVGFIDTGATWTPATVIEPGPDGLQGTGDDGRPITFYYDYGGTAASLVLTNPANAWRHYDGLQFIVTKRPSARWSAEASYTWSRMRGSFDNEDGSNAAWSDTGLYGNFIGPNRALYTGLVSTQDRPHDVKILGTYVPCCGVRVSGVYRYLSGQPWAREINVSPLTRFLTLGVEPTDANRLDSIYNDGDMRVEKTFQVTHSARIGAYVDLLNVGNRGVALRVDRRSGPRLGIPRDWRESRTVRLGMQLTF